MGKANYAKGNAMTLTIGQAARELGISDYLAEKLVREGKLRSVRLGKLVRVPRSALTELLEGEEPSN